MGGSEYYEKIQRPGKGPDTLQFMPDVRSFLSCVSNPSFSKQFRHLPREELPVGIVQGIEFTTFTIDTPHYLLYLLDRFKRNGGTLQKRKLKRLSSAIDESEPPAAIVNCSGLGAQVSFPNMSVSI